MAHPNYLDEDGNIGNEAADQAAASEGNSVAAHIRERQRAVAEREAARLARPEQRRTKQLQHADKRKSAVTSTPFGVLPKNTNLDVDEETEEWCGPFSVARQMIAKREELKRQREAGEATSEEHHPLDALMEQVRQEQNRKAHPSLQWKSKISFKNETTNLYAKRQKRMEVINAGRSQVPSLFGLCVQFVVNHFENVESLGDVDHDVRLAISNELITRNQLDARAFEAILEPFLEIIEVPDCSGIPQDTMAVALATTPRLRYLLLTHAGRCFGPKTIHEFLEKNTSAALKCLSISGAYILKDEDAAKLIERHASSLQSISFQTCPLLGDQLVNALLNRMGSGTLSELSLQEMTSFSKEQLISLASCAELWKNVKSITLKSVAGLTDDIVDRVLSAVGLSLNCLNLSENYELTDETLSSIRKYNPRLKTLIMNGVKELTSAGLEAMFTHPLDGLPAPAKLKVLKLSSVNHQAVTDEVMRLVTASASFQDVVYNDGMDCAPFASFTPRLVASRRSDSGGLVQLDLQGSTLVTDTMLEQLVATSPNTLEHLNISYCPLISDQGLGYLLAKMGRQLTNIQVWGCAQLTDIVFDGHDRIHDRSIRIEGAWMKKSGTRSLR